MCLTNPIVEKALPFWISVAVFNGFLNHGKVAGIRRRSKERALENGHFIDGGGEGGGEEEKRQHLLRVK
jgi:hypothetical protein